MKAIAYHKHGGREHLKMMDWPEPKIKRGHVKIQVHSIGLNPLDYRMRRGEMGPLTLLGPRMTGSDFSGTILELGQGVQNFTVGEEVMGKRMWGTAAERLVVAANKITPIPSNLDLATAATIPLVALTAYQMVHEQAKVQAGQHVIVNGASGGVGTYAAQLAKHAGATVTAVTSYRNVDWMSELGTDHTIDYTKDNCCAGDVSYDAFLDCRSNLSLHKVKNVLKPKGVYVTLEPLPSLVTDPFMNLLSAQKGRVVLLQNKQNQLLEIKRLIEAGVLKTFVHAKLSAKEITQAFEILESKRTRGKLSVKILDELG